MKRISLRTRFLAKRLIPAVWFGGLTLLAIVFLFGGGLQMKNLGAVLFFAVLAFMGWLFMRHAFRNVVDEVFDCGDHLLVRNNSEQEQVWLTNIMNVGYAETTESPRVTLTLVTPGKFGKEISFWPERKFSLNPFAKNPIVRDLIVRVDQARAARRT